MGVVRGAGVCGAGVWIGLSSSCLCGAAMRGVGACMIGVRLFGTGVGGTTILAAGSRGVGATMVGEATTVGEERRLKAGEAGRGAPVDLDLERLNGLLKIAGDGVGPSSRVFSLGVAGVGDPGACFFFHILS
jgi:hypothetical protein